MAAVGPISGQPIWLTVADSFDELIGLHPRVVCWAVDIPIGLPTTGRRECDSLARRELGPVRGSSVFAAPPLSAVKGKSYETACRLAERATGKKVSKQAWNLFPKIREVRETLIEEPRLRRRVFETHPELCFARIGDGPLAEPKKSPEGTRKRQTLLTAAFDAETVSRVVKQTEQTRGVGVDDSLDALACWTAAARDAGGTGRVVPRVVDTDDTGLPIAIRW